MKATKRTGKQRETTEVYEPLRRKLQYEGWFVQKIHGNEFQSGLPDVYAYHRKYGQRWIELKTKTGRLSQRQITKFAEMNRHGLKVWLLRGPEEYDLLFSEPKWMLSGNNPTLHNVVPKGFYAGKVPGQQEQIRRQNSKRPK